MFESLSAAFAGLFTIEALTTLLILTALETVLGFDNLLYISLEAKKTGPANEKRVRRIGLTLAIVFRIVLLIVILQLIELFSDPFYSVMNQFLEMELSGHALIVILGGVFLMYTALKEIFHMIGDPDLAHGESLKKRGYSSVGKVLALIVAVNLVFSFDTVLSAVALSDNIIVMTLAIIISGALMILMSNAVAAFLARNRMYEVLGLFVLLLVGILLIGEGGHLANLHLFGYEVLPMSKATFYLVLGTLVVVEIVQGRYQRRLLAEQERKQRIATELKEEPLLRPTTARSTS